MVQTLSNQRTLAINAKMAQDRIAKQLAYEMSRKLNYIGQAINTASSYLQNSIVIEGKLEEFEIKELEDSGFKVEKFEYAKPEYNITKISW